jgi:hexulose-6-phosphate isomerase
MLGSRITRVHVKDVLRHRGRCGHESVYTNIFLGDNDWPKIRAAFDQVGYNGWICAEIEPYRFAPDQQLFDTSAALDRFIAARF